MQNATLWRALLGVEKTVIEGVEFDEDEQLLVAHVRPRKRDARAGAVGAGDGHRPMTVARAGGGGGHWTWARSRPSSKPRRPGSAVASMGRRWRRCRGPGTRPGTPTPSTSRSPGWPPSAPRRAITELMRIAWRTVGAIITRVWADVEAVHDRFADLRRIGIDEISYKRGQQYLTVVVDHDSGRLVWAAPGREKATLERFFDALGERALRPDHPRQRRRRGLDQRRGRRPLPATRCAAPIPSTSSSGPPRPSTTSAARPGTPPAADQAAAVTGSDGRADASAKTPPGTRRRSSTPATRCGRTPRTSPPDRPPSWPGSPRPTPRLHRAYLLKEGLRLVFQLGYDEAVEALEAWIGWARRCRIPTFVDLQRRIVKHKASILAAIEHGLSNGRIESVNTKIRLITRVAFGFKSPDALIALAMLNLGGHRPALPGRK